MFEYFWRDAFREKKGQPLSIVEFGPGEGYFLENIAGDLVPVITDYEGIEANAPSIRKAIAKENYPSHIKYSYSIGNFLTTGLPDASRDGVVALSALDSTYVIEDALKEAYRILKPGGIFITVQDIAPTVVYRSNPIGLYKTICDVIPNTDFASIFQGNKRFIQKVVSEYYDPKTLLLPDDSRVKIFSRTQFGNVMASSDGNNWYCLEINAGKVQYSRPKKDSLEETAVEHTRTFITRKNIMDKYRDWFEKGHIIQYQEADVIMLRKPISIKSRDGGRIG